MMANIAFIGDCHLGFRHRSKVQRLRDYALAFEDAVSKALSMGPDVVVFLGDLVHHAKPDPVSLRTVVKRLMEAADRCQVVVCIGNHEIEGHLGTTYAPIYGDVHERIHVLSTENPEAAIDIGGRRYCFRGFEYTRQRESAEEKLKALSERLGGDVNILCLHQAIERYLSPHELSLPALRRAAEKYSLIMSGHVHKHQAITEVSDITPAYYCGSTERVSFNEAGNPTGFMFFRGDRFREPEYVPVDSATMSYQRLEFDGTPEELNALVLKTIESDGAKLLRIDVSADIRGDAMDVRRDWDAYLADRTMLEVNVAPKTSETEVKLERAELSEDLIREYFQKAGSGDGELEELCVELYRRYAG